MESRPVDPNNRDSWTVGGPETYLRRCYDPAGYVQGLRTDTRELYESKSLDLFRRATTTDTIVRSGRMLVDGWGFWKAFTECIGEKNDARRTWLLNNALLVQCSGGAYSQLLTDASTRKKCIQHCRQLLDEKPAPDIAAPCLLLLGRLGDLESTPAMVSNLRSTNANLSSAAGLALLLLKQDQYVDEAISAILSEAPHRFPQWTIEVTHILSSESLSTLSPEASLACELFYRQYRQYGKDPRPCLRAEAIEREMDRLVLQTAYARYTGKRVPMDLTNVKAPAEHGRDCSAHSSQVPLWTSFLPFCYVCGGPKPAASSSYPSI